MKKNSDHIIISLLIMCSTNNLIMCLTRKKSRKTRKLSVLVVVQTAGIRNDAYTCGSNINIPFPLAAYTALQLYHEMKKTPTTSFHSSNLHNTSIAAVTTPPLSRVLAQPRYVRSHWRERREVLTLPTNRRYTLDISSFK